MNIDIQEIIKQMQTKKDEFDALIKLFKAYNNLPAIVDDDYPKMRHYYESSLYNFITTLKNNKRI